jgi:hypothetical protein
VNESKGADQIQAIAISDATVSLLDAEFAGERSFTEPSGQSFSVSVVYTTSCFIFNSLESFGEWRVWLAWRSWLLKERKKSATLSVQCSLSMHPNRVELSTVYQCSFT